MAFNAANSRSTAALAAPGAASTGRNTVPSVGGSPPRSAPSAVPRSIGANDTAAQRVGPDDEAKCAAPGPNIANTLPDTG